MTMMLFMPAVGWAKTVRLYDLHLYDRLLQRYQSFIGLLGHVHGRTRLRSLLERCPQTLKRDGLALGGDGELEAAGRPWQR